MRKLIKYTFIIPVLLIYGCSWVEYFTENNKTDTPVLDDHIIRKYPSINNKADTSTSIIYYLQNKKEIPLDFIVNKTVIDSKNFVNSSYLMGLNDCDRDGDREYYYYSFLIEKDKIIVSENKVAEGQEIDDAIVVENIAYFIDESGNLITIQEK